jgi:hypothetical protein
LTRFCAVADCEQHHLAKGLCQAHYKRQYRNGSTARLTGNVTVRTGSTFGRLTVIERCAISKPKKWICRCECGKESLVFDSNLLRGHTTSCGCRQTEIMISHGQSKTKEYRAWIAMRTRCYNTKTPYYKDYGGRGITVCERWNSFELFLADMGPRPSDGSSVERRNVNGNYEPSNCYWATDKTQARNRRGTIYVSVGGEDISLAEASEKSGINYRTAHHRIFRGGWSVADALSKPAESKFSRRRGVS